MKRILSLVLFFALSSLMAQAQTNEDLMNEIKKLRRSISAQKHSFDAVMKKVDDVLWFDRLGDIAHIDKIFTTGPARHRELNPTGEGAGNPVKIWSYVFIPKSVKEGQKYPLMVYVHGGIHGDMSTYNTHMIRELISQEYVVVATDYRGSIGYGTSYYNNIDYGGLENQDCYEAKERVLENYSSILDRNRVGIMGWSHGGMITLMNLATYQNDYKCGYAGVPVSDVIARLGYKRQSYEDLFSTKYHVGKIVNADIQEYRRRSPVYHADKINTPLLIYTNTIDEDVNVYEVENMINALLAKGKKFEYKIWEKIPGGHSYDRMDHKAGYEIRYGVYKFLNKYLKPNKAFKSINDMKKAAYKFY